ncbi:zinc knuckle CX2CX4HX4C containing protein [Tanacetum coccineum]
MLFIPYKVSHVDDSTMAENINVDESAFPSIVQTVDINTMSTSYVELQRMTFPVVEYYARNNWAKHGLKKIMMNSKGFFFFKFDSRAGFEAVLKGGPWLIRRSLIILKKWSMDTRLLKEELTRIPIWVKLHVKFLKSSFSWCLIKVNSKADLMDIVNIGIPSLIGDGFTKETIRVKYEWRPPSKKKKRKGKSKSTNDGQFVGPSVKQNVRYETKVTTGAPKKGATNMGNPSTSSSMLKTTGTSKKDHIPTSNSYYILNDEEGEEEEEVVNVYDETAKLSTKTVGSSPFTAVVG